MSDEPLLKTEVGWYGLLTRRQADGAIANGERIVKVSSEDGDTVPDGSLGTVLGSLGPFPPEAAAEAKAELVAKGLEPRDVTYAYCVEWDAYPRHPILTMDFKVARANGG